MIHFHDLLPAKHSLLQGSTTYATDFKQIILPELQNMDTKGEQIDYCIALNESRQNHNAGRKHIMEVHFNYDWEILVKSKFLDGVDGVIAHSRATETYLKNLDLPGLRVYFIPMSIDLSVLPTSPATRLNRWIYLGNLNNASKRANEEIFHQEFPNAVDTLSYGQFNNDVPIRPHEECMNIASQYTYGAGVGRSLLELLGMGLKCMVVGKKYGGPVRNDTDLLAHLEQNCNSFYYSSSTGNVNNDYAQLVSGGVITKSLIDMNTRKSDYVAVINDILSV